MSPSWHKYLPVKLRNKIEGRPSLQKIFTNAGWLFGDKILRMGVGLIVSVWVARYLGPEQFGLMIYAMAIVALFVAVARLGLNSIVVRDLVNEPGSANSTLGTTFFLQLAGGLLAYVLAIIAINLSRPDDGLAKLIVVVLGFALVFKSTDVVKYWFESQVQSKYVVWMGNSIFLVLAVVKIGLILIHAPLMAFIWVTFIEGLMVAVGLIGLYVWHVGNLRGWRFDVLRAKGLLRESWPLLLSGLAIVVYMRIDQIMLGHMLGDDAVGVYSAAVRISEAWYFIPMAIVASVFPSIIQAKKQSETLYHERLQKLYDLMVILALVVAVPMTFFSGEMITMLFGVAYSEAGIVLAIYVWAGVFVFLGVASSKWLLLGGYQKVMLYRTLFGALINIQANWLLIPLFGIRGAALATVISYFIAAFSVFLRSDTRISAIMMARSFILNKSITRMRNV
jgi:O-antigen/teichoic acid export membrane protein